METESPHQSVLIEEGITGLDIKQNGFYVDGTFGRGGHTRGILKGLGVDGRLLVIDKDPEAVKAAERMAADDSRLIVERGTFAMLQRLIEGRDMMGKVDGVLLDLGVSSPQLNDPDRGFSFMNDGPLDMRMDDSSGLPVSQWLHTASEQDITRVLREYGEERFAKRIARAIVNTRIETPIETTRQLSDIVSQASPTHDRHKHPATRTFQALRIFINNELEDLKACLSQILDVLAVSGRLVVISFHSLEDRIVKRFIRTHARGGEFPPGMPVTAQQFKPRLRAIGKAVFPSAEEIERNPRARSAVMRIAEKIC